MILIERRFFLKKAALFFGSLVLSACGLRTGKDNGVPVHIKEPAAGREKLIFVSIDALHPAYFELNARGYPGGSDGDWLMPNIRAFLKEAVWYRNAKSFLPAATDMNHLNALAGTSAAQTGIIGVWAQPVGWDNEGNAVISPTSLSFARDDRGRPVDTLFQAWKRRWPDSKTLLITGKEWVGEMFRRGGEGPAVDLIVTGSDYPSYLPPPEHESFADPLTDEDAACDPESGRPGFFDGPMGLGDIMTRAYTGQGSLLTFQMEQFAGYFPHDRWIVESTLTIFDREDPDMAYILLAQCDDAGHCIGSAWDPEEFITSEEPYKTPEGCEKNPAYQMVSSRNRLLFREAILDAVRDVDIQFGRFMEGLEKRGIRKRATIILLSDHSAVNHLATDDFSSTDVMGLLERTGIIENNVYAFSVSSYGVLYWRTNKEQIPLAKGLLEAHRAMNPQTGKYECPWWVLDRKDMKHGVQGVSLPNELYHTYYVEIDRERTMIWPDLIILAKNGWQIPVYNGHIPNVGIKVPQWTPPWRVYNGGHGSVDTLPIVAALSYPGGPAGIDERPVFIADLGVTAASLFGLKLASTTVGKNLVCAKY